MDGTIITFTGKRFKPLEPDPVDIDLLDIAHALSNLCRYTGHTKFFYPVGTHCVLMHDWGQKTGLDKETCFELLIHDASEAYLLDLAAPLKHHAGGFGDTFREAELAIEEAIAIRYDIPFPASPVVKELDLQIRETEMDQLFPRGVERDHWGEKLPITIPYWLPERAEYEFLVRLQDHGYVWRGPTNEGAWREVVRVAA